MRGRIIVLVSVLLAAAGSAFLLAALNAGESAAGVVTTASDAVTLASAYTGLPEDAAASAVERVVTDASVPVFEVKDLPVWEVTYEGITIAVPGPEGKEEQNPNIHTVTVWVDRETGALIKVFTPTPAEGALTDLVGPAQAGMLSGNGFTLKAAPEAPGKPLLAALPGVHMQFPGAVMQAKQMGAYYGLLTRKLGLETRFVDRPAWLVYLGGVSQPFASTGPAGGPPRPPVVGSEALVILDATSGRPLSALLTHQVPQASPPES